MRGTGWRSERAISVVDALAWLRRNFDAVLLNLNLGDGGHSEEVLELLATLRAPIAVVVHGGCGTRAGANKLGLDGIPYLEQPFAPGALLATLDEEVELTRLVTACGLIGIVARLEKQLLRAMLGKLRTTRGNQHRVAVELGIPRTTLRDKMAIYGLRSAAFRGPTNPPDGR